MKRIHIKYRAIAYFIISFVFLANIASAASPSVSVSVLTDSEIYAGESDTIKVQVAEYSGEDWMKDVTVKLQIGGRISEVTIEGQEQSISRIDAGSSHVFSFPIKYSEDATPSTNTISAVVEYYETGALGVGTYGPYYSSAQNTLEVKDPYGRLKIESNPSSADVYFNGRHEGITPLEMNKINPGKYKIVFKKNKYLDAIDYVVVKEGLLTEVTANLKEAVGSVHIESNPSEAKVYLDGDYKGRTPLNLELPIDTYSIEIKKSGYESERKQLSFDESDAGGATMKLLGVKLEKIQSSSSESSSSSSSSSSSKSSSSSSSSPSSKSSSSSSSNTRESPSLGNYTLIVLIGCVYMVVRMNK